MRRAAVVSSLATISCLNLILLLGAGVPDRTPIRLLFNGLILTMDLGLVTSSGLLCYLFASQGRKALAALFAANIGVYAVAVALRAAGVAFPTLLLFAADLYWLNLYLVCLRWISPSEG